MKMTPLKDVCKVVSGSTPKRNKSEYWGGNIPWVTPKEISELKTIYLVDSVEKITDLGYRSCSTTMLPPKSVLLSSRAPIGLLAITKKSVCTNQGFKSLIPSESIHSEYLYYCLKNNIKALQARGNGATFKELSKVSVEEFKILLPSLDDQMRIAYLLGKVEGLIARRKQHLQQLDDLLKSVFLKMFGDPVRNERGWNKDHLSKRCQKITDGTHDTPERLTEGVPFITGKHLRPYIIDYEGCDFVSAEDHKAIYGRCDPKYGDILYTNIGVNLGTAAMNVVHYEFSMKNVALLRPKVETLNSRFLEHYLNFEKVKAKIISDLSSGGAQKFLGLGQIKKISIILPSITLQNKFAAVVEKVEGIKSRYQQSLSDLETLYGVLSQRAFKGELDLSRVPLPIEEPDITGEEKSEAEGIRPTEPPFELPAPANLVVLQSAEGRRTLLDQWLTAWIEQPGKADFSAQSFMDAARQRMWELVEDDAPGWGVAEYDQLKAWVFEALEKGRLIQSYDNAENRVRITAAKE